MTPQFPSHGVETPKQTFEMKFLKVAYEVLVQYPFDQGLPASMR